MENENVVENQPQQETPQVEQPPTIEEQEKRIEYFLKKKNLYHLKENVLNEVANVEKEMEKVGIDPKSVSLQDLKQGRALPETVQIAFEKLEKARIRATGSLAHAVREADKSGELVNFKDEYNNVQKQIVAEEQRKKHLSEAYEKMQNHPTKENRMEYVKIGVGLDTKPFGTLRAKDDVDLVKRHQEGMQGIRERINEENRRMTAMKPGFSKLRGDQRPIGER
jgi:hypothetical protein